MRTEPLPEGWDDSPKGCWTAHPETRETCELPPDGHRTHKRKHPNGVEVECWDSQMTLEEVGKVGNEGSVQLCQALLDTFGPGKEYRCAVSAAASNLLVHAFRVVLPQGKAKAIELLQAILDDAAENARRMGGDKIKFRVEAP